MKELGYEEKYILKSSDIELENNFDTALLNINRDEYERFFGISQLLAIKQKQVLLNSKLNKNSLVIKALPIVVTTRCTLNCKYCFAKIPYFYNREDVDIDFLIREMDKVLSVVDKIEWLEIFGREPLLYKDLWKLVKYINQPKVQEKVVYSIILTNGTVLFDDKTLEQISENKRFWKIAHSPYGKYSNKQFALFEQCNENNVFYFSRSMPYWHKFGIISEPNDPEIINSDKCISCCCYVPTFFDGKMYSCETLAFAGYLKMFPEDKRNYLDIFSEEFTKEKLRDFLKTPQPAMAWCNANHKTHKTDDSFTGEIIPVAEQAKGILPYNRYE